MVKKLIDNHDKALIDACRFDSEANGIDKLIREWASYTGCSDVQWMDSLIPFVISRIHKVYIKIYGSHHFLDMLRVCYEESWRYATDKRCNQTSKDGIHYTHLEWWLNKLRWIPNTDFVVLEVSKTKEVEISLIGEEQEF
jgi:hypothetical protein